MNDCDAAVVRTILFLCSYMNDGNAAEEVCFHSYVAAQQMQKCIAEGFCKRMTTTTTAMIHCYHTNVAMAMHNMYYFNASERTPSSRIVRNTLSWFSYSASVFFGIQL